MVHSKKPTDSVAKLFCIPSGTARTVRADEMALEQLDELDELDALELTARRGDAAGELGCEAVGDSGQE